VVFFLLTSSLRSIIDALLQRHELQLEIFIRDSAAVLQVTLPRD